jgi:quinol monooxygenase YgiN
MWMIGRTTTNENFSSPLFWNSMTYNTIVTFTTSPGKGSEFASILLEASKLIAKVKGCQCYLVSQDVLLNDTITVYELWESKEDHAESLKLEAVRDLIKTAMPLLGGKPVKTECNFLGGHGTPQ